MGLTGIQVVIVEAGPWSGFPLSFSFFPHGLLGPFVYRIVGHSVIGRVSGLEGYPWCFKSTHSATGVEGVSMNYRSQGYINSVIGVRGYPYCCMSRRVFIVL